MKKTIIKYINTIVPSFLSTLLNRSFNILLRTNETQNMFCDEGWEYSSQGCHTLPIKGFQKKNRHKPLLWLFLLSAIVSMQAQQVCENSRKQVALSDGIKVWLFKERSGNRRVYYVPTTLQLSRNKGRPEFSYQEYTEAKSTSPDGAILHFLVTWGLDQRQLEELEICVKEHYGKNALLGSALYLEPAPSGLTIGNTNKIGKILKASLQSKGNPPTMAGGKTALSFHIKKDDVKTISEAFEKPEKLSGTTLGVTYRYKTHTCGSISTVTNNTITLKANLETWF